MGGKEEREKKKKSRGGRQKFQLVLKTKKFLGRVRGVSGRLTAFVQFVLFAFFSCAAGVCDRPLSWRRASSTKEPQPASSEHIASFLATTAKMWLDRLSANQAGSGASSPYNHRSYSPAHRVNKPARPTFSPRSSSLSFASTPNASAISLPGTQQHQSNGLTARRDGRSPSANVPDPLDVLNNILGRELSPNAASNDPEPDVIPLAKPETLVDTIEFGELSLEEFAEQEEYGGMEPPLHNSYDLQSIEQCEAHMATGTLDDFHVNNVLVYIDEKERERFQDLHSSIAVCTIPIVL